MSPIRPENVALYPADWPEISRRVKDRAGWRCECRGECGQPHVEERCASRHGDAYRLDGTPRSRPVVLTTAHLDHDPTNSDAANLRAYCQGCHNRYDMSTRAANRRKRLAREAGQATLDGLA